VAAAALSSLLWVPVDLAAQNEGRGSQSAASGVLVYGQVIDDDSGHPVAGATVSLAGTSAGLSGRGTRLTDSEGKFRFRDVPEGIYRLYVTAQDYDQMVDSLPVRSDRDLRVTLPLSTDGGSLEPLYDTNDPAEGGRRDYTQRRRGGGSGFLITQDEIDERRPRYITEMLNRVPGGMLIPAPGGGYQLLLRSQCRPGVWMDGVRLGTSAVDQLVAPQEVEALEVYHGFELPVEFGVNSCGGILIWTRRGVAPPPAPGEEQDNRSILGRFLQVGLLVVAIIIATG
jgi:hypothetical protein